MKPNPIQIVGGGLAGLSLGIALRRRGIPVLLFEAGHYPRHRVCGEFISGRGQHLLDELGLREDLLKAGAILARSTVFYYGHSASPVRPVKPPAICLSRYKMDALLAERFRAAGGELEQNAPRRERVFGEGVVRATGRRVQPLEHGWRWFGIKVHARKVPVSADLEMHCFADQYVGLGRIEEDKVNLCGLFRRQAGRGISAGELRGTLLGPPGSSLRRRLEGAAIDESSWCSVAGLPLQPQRAAGRDECCIGDALSMIPPATGNGMSMAFEAAAVAAAPLEAYSRGELNWYDARESIARKCDRLFSRRLRWGALLQRLLFLPCMSGTAGRFALRSEGLWKFLFANTR